MELRISGPQEPNLRLKEEILNELIFYSLLKNWAEKNNVKPNKALLSREEKLLFSKSKKKRKAFKIFKTYSRLKQALLEELEKKTPKPPLQQQKAYYKKNKTRFQRAAQCRLEQILVAEKKRAQKLYERIKKGESFSALSRHYSLKQGPGWVKKGQWPLFDQVCFKESESLSRALKSPYGWHIFLRKEKKASRQKSFSESQTEIIKTLKKQELSSKLKSWLKQESSNQALFKDKKLLDQIKIQYKREGL